MIRVLADVNFNNHIIRGLLLRNPELDIVRVSDVGLRGMDDPIVMEYALNDHRILITHDVNTIPKYA